jgi:hypothetical protein
MAYFAEIRKDKHSYKRFIDRLDLRAEGPPHSGPIAKG